MSDCSSNAPASGTPVVEINNMDSSAGAYSGAPMADQIQNGQGIGEKENSPVGHSMEGRSERGNSIEGGGKTDKA